jgi:hypothetical protein
LGGPVWLEEVLMKIHFKVFELLELAEGMAKSLHGSAPDAELAFTLAKLEACKGAIATEPLRPSDCQAAKACLRLLPEITQPFSGPLSKVLEALGLLLDACEGVAGHQVSGEILLLAVDKMDMPESMRDFLRKAAEKGREEPKA